MVVTDPTNKFVVRTVHNGEHFWLRGTTWSFQADRATRFNTRKAAQDALDVSRKFNAKAAYHAARIEEERP